MKLKRAARAALFFFGGDPAATTRSIPIHAGKDRTARQSLSVRIHYATNPAKTQNGEMVAARESLKL